MRLIHSMIPVVFPVHPSSDKQWDIVTREKKSLLHFPLFPCHVFPLLFFSALIFSSFLVLFIMSSPCSCWAPSEWKVPLGEVVAAGRGGCVCVFVGASVWPNGHPCTEGPLCTSPVYNTSTRLHCALLLLFCAAAANPALWHFHVHTYKHAPNRCPVFTTGRNHSFFPGREMCRELCGSEPSALALTACDAATNSNRVPLVWNILLLCFLLRWE